VKRAERQDAEIKAEAERLKKLAPAKPPVPLVQPDEKVLRWLPWAFAGAVMLVWAVGGALGNYEPAQPVEEPAVSRAEAPDAGIPDGGTSGVGEEVLTSASVDPAIRGNLGIAMSMPEGPLDGQRRPPCMRDEYEIRGGCWIVHPSMKPPCEGNGYEWNEGCYVPMFSKSRKPTSDPP
jgi:hypothetical protein